VIIELTLFSHENQLNLSVRVQEAAVRNMAHQLLLYRNLFLQTGNDDTTEVPRYFRSIKDVDPIRIFTNSSGFPGLPGEAEAENELVSLLTPYTERRGAGRFLEVALLDHLPSVRVWQVGHR
jgi:hypothetical protein